VSLTITRASNLQLKFSYTDGLEGAREGESTITQVSCLKHVATARGLFKIAPS
jgi:hypothetical protein